MLCLLQALLAGPAWGADVADAAGAPPSDRELLRALQACALLEEQAARLGCFDTLAASLQGVEALPDADDRPVMEHPVHASVLRLEQRPHGEWILYLSNGQIWTELEPSRVRYRQGMTVRIHRTQLGGYRLSTSFGRSTRVRRVE